MPSTISSCTSLSASRRIVQGPRPFGAGLHARVTFSRCGVRHRRRRCVPFDSNSVNCARSSDVNFTRYSFMPQHFTGTHLPLCNAAWTALLLKDTMALRMTRTYLAGGVEVQVPMPAEAEPTQSDRS
jgi:hypothetical protein